MKEYCLVHKIIRHYPLTLWFHNHHVTIQGGLSVVLNGGGFKYNKGEGVTPIAGSVSDGMAMTFPISRTNIFCVALTHLIL